MTYPINIIDFYYFSHDPIGRAGGFNTYNYVDNPNNWVDPLGLYDVTMPEGQKSTTQILNETGQRFIGEHTARDYLVKNNCDALLAWTDIRNHRNTYRGLIESDRNAEHYLYAYGSLEQNLILKELASFGVLKRDTAVIKISLIIFLIGVVGFHRIEEAL